MTALHRLAVGGVEVVVSARAAALRLARVGGVHLVEPTLDAPGLPGMSGAVLAPWPNRVEDATWWNGGREERLPVTEPEFGHANHGLLAETEFAVERITRRRLDLLAVIDAPDGYPFRLAVRVRYLLRRDGLDVRIGVRNTGSRPAPVALGVHPYLRLGDEPAERLRLVIDADSAYRLDERHIPREEFPVAGTAWDLRAGRPVPDAPHHASFRRGGRGLVRHALVDPGGRAVELRAGREFRFTQLYLAEQFPADDGPRRAVAVEPMTAPPNAMRSGVGLRLLAPGRSWRTGFRLRLVPRSRQGRSRVR